MNAKMPPLISAIATPITAAIMSLIINVATGQAANNRIYRIRIKSTPLMVGVLP